MLHDAKLVLSNERLDSGCRECGGNHRVQGTEALGLWLFPGDCRIVGLDTNPTRARPAGPGSFLFCLMLVYREAFMSAINGFYDYILYKM